MSSESEMFNQHQQDLKSRTDSLVKAILILAGGSLTISIGLFLQQGRLPLSETSLFAIRFGWWLLFATIIFGVLTLYTVVMRDYFFGERWLKKINGNMEIDVSGTPKFIENIILIFGNLGVLSFILGMLCFAYVATATVVIT